MFDCDERLTRLAAAIDEFVAEEFDATGAPPQSQVLLGLFEQIDRLQAESVRRTGVWRDPPRRARRSWGARLAG